MTLQAFSIKLHEDTKELELGKRRRATAFIRRWGNPLFHDAFPRIVSLYQRFCAIRLQFGLKL